MIFLNKILNNNLFKAFSFNSVIVLGRLITSFVVSKVSAIYLGPSGYAIVGNFKNILQGLLGITSVGFESGIIKYIAENKSDKKNLNIIVSSVFTFSVIISIIASLFLLIFSNELALSILKDKSLAFVFKYLSALLPFISLNFLIVYITNGLQKFKLYTLLIGITNVANAVVTFVLVYFFSLEGALVASIFVPVLSLGFSILIKEIRELFVLGIKNFKTLSISFLKSISIYIIMAIYSTILISLCYLFIRNNIIQTINMEAAGLWEAMNKLSTFYMIFFSSLMTLYLLPLLAENKTINGYVVIMNTYFKYLIPFTIVLFLGIFFFKTLIIKILLTNEFVIIEQFFYLQLFGDFIKIAAFSFAYQFHAKKMAAPYFITDAILYGSFCLLGIYSVEHFNLEGIFYAYIVSALLYLISVCFFVFFRNNKYLTSEKQ